MSVPTWCAIVGSGIDNEVRGKISSAAACGGAGATFETGLSTPAK